MTSKPISRLWFLGPPAAILLSIFVYYAKFQSVRHWVDERFPWVEENVGSRLPPFPPEYTPPRNRAPRQATDEETAPPSPSSSSAPAPAPINPLAPPPLPNFVGPDGRVDVAKLAEFRTAWPKTVKLTASKEFPAVVNGKVVGKLAAPAGTEANLVSIKDGNLGVEYQGGGAWLKAEETDLAERLRH